MTISEYEEELVIRIERAKEKMELIKETFSKYEAGLKGESHTAYEMLRHGSIVLTYQTQDTIRNATWALSDIRASRVKKAETDRRAAETEKMSAKTNSDNLSKLLLAHKQQRAERK
jgi:hypothetical protein